MKYRYLLVVLILLLGVLGLIDNNKPKTAHAALNNTTQAAQSGANDGYWHHLWLKSHNMFSGAFQPKNAIISKQNGKACQVNASASKSVLQHKLSGSSPQAASYESQHNGVEMTQSTGSQTYVYITENAANDVIRCKFGQFSLIDCETVLNNLSGPEQIFIVKNQFFIVNYIQSSLSSCNLTANGEIESCSQTALPISEATYIIYNNYSLFITDMNIKKTAQCNLDYNYSVISCAVVSPLVSPNLNNTPFQLFNTATYQQYTYLSLYNNNWVYTVNKCVESACTAIHDPNLSGPNTVQILNSTAYITDGNTNNLLSCNLNSNGDFAPCKILKGGFRLPVSVAFYSPGT